MPAYIQAALFSSPRANRERVITKRACIVVTSLFSKADASSSFTLCRNAHPEVRTSAGSDLISTLEELNMLAILSEDKEKTRATHNFDAPK